MPWYNLQPFSLEPPCDICYGEIKVGLTDSLKYSPYEISVSRCSLNPPHFRHFLAVPILPNHLCSFYRTARNYGRLHCITSFLSTSAGEKGGRLAAVFTGARPLLSQPAAWPVFIHDAVSLPSPLILTFRRRPSFLTPGAARLLLPALVEA